MTTLSKTPEREVYERAVTNVIERTRSFAELTHRLAEKAASFGVVITIKEVPLMPPAMGHYDLATEARPSRDIQQQLVELEAAAKESEQAREEYARNCSEGIHSWIDESPNQAPDTKCVHCGEPYGNPS